MKIETDKLEEYIGKPVYVIIDNKITRTMVKSIDYHKAIGGITPTEEIIVTTTLGEHNQAWFSKDDMIKYIKDDIQ